MLRLQDITVIYPDKTKAVQNISFTLQKNDTVALIGGNGAGKTSLLLAAAGILRPAMGSIEICGIQLTKDTIQEVRKKLGFIFQNPDDQLFMPLLYEDVAFGLRNLGLPQEEIKKRVDGILDWLHISHLKERSSLKLSGGEKRMAAIAAVLVMEPAVLLFDEPTAFLDPRAKRLLADVFHQMHHPKIIATHDMDFARKTCNRVLILKDGQAAGEGELSLLEDTLFLEECGL